MNDDDELERIEVASRVRDAVTDAVRGTVWEPADGAVMVDCAVIMGWYRSDGTFGSSFLLSGAPWAGRGLIAQTLDAIEARYDDEIHDDED